VMRRTGLHLAGGLGREALVRCAALMAELLGWDQAQREREVELAMASLTRYRRSGHE